MKRNYFAVGIALTAAALVASVALYPYLPPQMPTHWNIHGQVDDYGAKSWAAFLSPAIMAAMLALFRLFPWLSPKRFEVDTFRSTYLYMMVVLLAFFAYIHGLMLWAGLKGPWDISRALFGGVCLLFVLLGNVLGKVQRNFWIGVRTPSMNACGTPHIALPPGRSFSAACWDLCWDSRGPAPTSALAP
jgi:uncharacterized membrane protein